MILMYSEGLIPVSHSIHCSRVAPLNCLLDASLGIASITRIRMSWAEPILPMRDVLRAWKRQLPSPGVFVNFSHAGAKT